MFQLAESTVGVDRTAERINGFIVAESGPFRSEGRGEFDEKSLKSILRLSRGHSNGLRSRFTHPVWSDGLGSLLGRAKNFRLDTVTRIDEQGQRVQRQAVRADLHISPVSHSTPHGDLGQYILDLAEEDPDAMGASLVLKSDKEYRSGRDKLGMPLPPLWRPTELHAVDIVDTGDSTRAFLDSQYPKAERAIVRGIFASHSRLSGSQAGELTRIRIRRKLEQVREISDIQLLRLRMRLRGLGVS